jgi:hypothetical protein
MMKEKPSRRRVVLAKEVARRWIQSCLRPEYQLKVYYGAREIRKLPDLLRSFRDGKLKIGSVEPIPDLGIREEFDHVVAWSRHKEGLIKLRDWCEERGCETTGIW